MCGLLPVVSRESRSGACMLWLVFQVGEKASQLSLSVEVRAGDGARASGPLEELPAFLGSVVVETTRGIAVSGSRGRRGRAHQGVGDIPFWKLARLVGRLRYLSPGCAAAVALLEGGFRHSVLKRERVWREEKLPKPTARNDRRSNTDSPVGIFGRCELLGKSAKIGCWLWLWGSSYGTAVAGDVEDGEEEENAVVVGRVGGVVQL